MIVVMHKDSSEAELQHVVDRVQEMGLETVVLRGTNRTVIAAIGDKRNVDKESLLAAPGVENVVPILAPYKIASRDAKPESTEVPIDSTTLGGQRVGVIAGPCTVEDRTMLLETAHAVKEAGAVALRGGAYKPRTNPYDFQGLGEQGLEYLAEAAEQTGLSVVTEVLGCEHVPVVAKYADVLQIGTRNAQNFQLLSAVGEQRKPVLLKRGMSAKLDEFLLAAEYILSRGNHQVILCERGIRTFEDHTRNTLSLSAVPELKSRTHLPVIADPSHGTGRRHLVNAMSRAAVAAGADGLLIEVHPDPERAVTDGAQSLNCQEFEALMKELKTVAKAIGREM